MFDRPRYHGAHTAFALHIGQCFAADEDVARSYAGQGLDLGVLAEVRVDLTGLVVVEVEGYDRDTNHAVGDLESDDLRGADVLVYTDVDLCGREHTTWRLVTQRAVDAVTVIAVVDLDEEEEEEEEEY